jgi:hypothetical protein
MNFLELRRSEVGESSYWEACEEAVEAPAGAVVATDTASVDAD